MAKAKKSPKKVSKKVRDLKNTIANVAIEAILAGATVEGVLKAVKRAFPGSHTGKNSVMWYRSEMRRRGMKVPDLARPEKAGKAKKDKSKRENAKPAALAPDEVLDETGEQEEGEEAAV